MIRTILATLTLAATATAHAGTIGYLSTPTGSIRLQDTQSTCPRGALYVITKLDGDEWIGGCWTMLGDKIFIQYANRQQHIYSARAFTRVVPGPSNPTSAWGSK